MNIHKAIMELHDKAQMAQTIAGAMAQLEEWNYESENVETAKKLLGTELEKMRGEIDQLQDYIAGGQLDIEQALEDVQ